MLIRVRHYIKTNTLAIANNGIITGFHLDSYKLINVVFPEAPFILVEKRLRSRLNTVTVDACTFIYLLAKWGSFNYRRNLKISKSLLKSLSYYFFQKLICSSNIVVSRLNIIVQTVQTLSRLACRRS